MRKINPASFTTAKQGTSRDINRQIVLTLIRVNQPVSRADLSRLMNTNRAIITGLVNELIGEGLVREAATGTQPNPQSKRGRRPTFLYFNSNETYAIAVDIRATKTFIMITDMLGKQISDVVSFPTELKPLKFTETLCRHIQTLQLANGKLSKCAGIGVVVPGMVNSLTGAVIRAPTLRWRNVDLASLIRKIIADTPVYVENSGKACALSQIWTMRNANSTAQDLVFVSVSDGVGVGVISNGKLVSGQHNMAGEYGHVSLNIDGPLCSCGAHGCWEAYISNLATLSRYYDTDLSGIQLITAELSTFTMEDLIKLARRGNSKALLTLQMTARYLGLGLASILNTLDPSQICIAGEITDAWDIIELPMRQALAERALTDALKKTPIVIVPLTDYPRLKGAATLVTARTFAAPEIA